MPVIALGYDRSAVGIGFADSPVTERLAVISFRRKQYIHLRIQFAVSTVEGTDNRIAVCIICTVRGKAVMSENRLFRLHGGNVCDHTILRCCAVALFGRLFNILIAPAQGLSVVALEGRFSDNELICQAVIAVVRYLTGRCALFKLVAGERSLCYIGAINTLTVSVIIVYGVR